MTFGTYGSALPIPLFRFHHSSGNRQRHRPHDPENTNGRRNVDEDRHALMLAAYFQSKMPSWRSPLDSAMPANAPVVHHFQRILSLVSQAMRQNVRNPLQL